MNGPTLAEQIAKKHREAWQEEEDMSTQEVILAAIRGYSQRVAEKIRAAKYDVDSLQWEQGLEQAARILEAESGETNV